MNVYSQDHYSYEPGTSGNITLNINGSTDDTTPEYSAKTKSQAATLAYRNQTKATTDLNSSINMLVGAVNGTKSGIADYYDLLGGNDILGDIKAETDGYTDEINAQMDAAVQAAGERSARMTNDAAAVRGTASDMSEDIEAIRALSGQLEANGANLTNSGNEYLQAGSQILNNDAGATGMAGEFLSALRAIDPNKYASAAAADVQSSYNGTYQQMMRSLSRSGSGGSSGNAQALKQQWGRALATAKAAAKTKATQTGTSERLSALSSAITTAASASTAGKNLVDSANSALSSAATARTSATSAAKNQADVYASAADIEKNAAGIDVTAASTSAAAKTSALSAVTGALNSAYGQQSSMLNAATTAQGAYNSALTKLAEGFQSRATYYNEQAKSWGEIAGAESLANKLYNTYTIS